MAIDTKNWPIVTFESKVPFRYLPVPRAGFFAVVRRRSDGVEAIDLDTLAKTPDDAEHLAAQIAIIAPGYPRPPIVRTSFCVMQEVQAVSTCDPPEDVPIAGGQAQ